MDVLAEKSKTSFLITHSKRSTSDLINRAIKYAVMWDESLDDEERRVLSTIYNGEISLIDGENKYLDRYGKVFGSIMDEWRVNGYTPDKLDSIKIRSIKQARSLDSSLSLYDAKTEIEKYMDIYTKDYNDAKKP